MKRIDYWNNLIYFNEQNISKRKSETHYLRFLWDFFFSIAHVISIISPATWEGIEPMLSITQEPQLQAGQTVEELSSDVMQSVCDGRHSDQPCIT